MYQVELDDAGTGDRLIECDFIGSFAADTSLVALRKGNQGRLIMAIPTSRIVQIIEIKEGV